MYVHSAPSTVKVGTMPIGPYRTESFTVATNIATTTKMPRRKVSAIKMFDRISSVESLNGVKGFLHLVCPTCDAIHAATEQNQRDSKSDKSGLTKNDHQQPQNQNARPECYTH